MTYNYDLAGRLADKDALNLAFTGTLGDGVTRNYSTEIIYSPFGGIAKEKFGTDTPLYNKSFYNSRGQLSEIRVSTSYTGPPDTTWNRGAIINHYSSQGLTRDLSRNPVPRSGSRRWDHFTEVTDAIKGLKYNIRGLQRSLQNPRLDPQARVEIQQAIEKAQNYITRVEKIIRSH